MSEVMAWLGLLTDPTDEITNGEAKGRCHPWADLSRCLLSVVRFIVMSTPDQMKVRTASSFFFEFVCCSHWQPCSAGGAAGWLMQPRNLPR